MPKKIQNFARSALVKPITVNVGRAGAANRNVRQIVEFVKPEARIVHILECLQRTAPPVSIKPLWFSVYDSIGFKQTKFYGRRC